MQRARIESVGASLPASGLLKRGSLSHATRAGRACLEASHYHPMDVEVFINAGVHRDGHYAEPAVASFILKKLGINVEFQGRQTLGFDLLNSGCGMLSGAHVLDTMMRAGDLRVGMVVASESNTDRTPDPSYRIRPSGAALMLDVAPSANRGFGNFAFRTFDEHAELYSSVVSLAVKRGKLLVRKQAELERSYLDCVKPVWRELLEREGCRAADIDLLLPSQVSPEFVAGLADALDLPKDRVFDVAAELGDTLSTSPFLAYELARQQGRVARGAKIAFLAVGAGITVGAASYDC